MKKYYSRAKFVAWVLRGVPFLRCVILTGSLARGDAKYGSDIDLLIIGKSGRLFTVRFFVTAAAFIMGIKRSNNPEKEYAGRICLNYYLSDDFLVIPTGRGNKIDRYCAENYSKAKFLSGDYRLFEEFIKTNEQLFARYLSSREKQRDLQNYGSKRFLHVGRNDNHGIIEKILSRKLGDNLELRLKSEQIRRIEADPALQKHSDLIVYNDRELRFHPSKI